MLTSNLLTSTIQEEPVGGSKPVKSQGSGCGVAFGSNGCPATRSTLERLCQARRARRAARRLREQQRQAPKLPSNLDILEQHTREVLKRLEVGPLEEVRSFPKEQRSCIFCLNVHLIVYYINHCLYCVSNRSKHVTKCAFHQWCKLLPHSLFALVCASQDQAFCAKVHGKLNKVSTASAAAAAESLEDNHLRLMLVNGRIIRWEFTTLLSTLQCCCVVHLIYQGSVVICSCSWKKKSGHKYRKF